MRILVSGSGAFVGAHVESEALRRGHTLAAPVGPADAVIHLSTGRPRAALDDAWARGARTFVLLSTVGASSGARDDTRAAAGVAEERVRASGLRWAALRPEILWGSGDVFTNELARLLRHLPFVPMPRGGVKMAPVHVRDAAEALLRLVESPELHGHVWSLRGPEELRYGHVVERVAQAVHGPARRRLSVPAWSVRLGAALEEKAAGRPRESRSVVDWRVAVEVASRATPIPDPGTLQPMSIDALRAYLASDLAPDQQASQSL